MLQYLKFRSVYNNFQNKLKNNIRNINSSNKVIVFADKSRNLYKLDKESHKKLLTENVTKSYRKADEHSINLISRDFKKITNNLNLGDRMEATAEKPAFITLKDHKDNFLNNPSCRLINPAKSNLGKVSKIIYRFVVNRAWPSPFVNASACCVQMRSGFTNFEFRLAQQPC